MSWRDTPLAFDTQHAEWVTMSPQLFNTGFFFFYQSSTHGVQILALPTFPFLFCLFLDTVTFPVVFLSLSFRQDLQFPILWEQNIQNPFISEAILRHLVPYGQFVTMWNARRYPWGWPPVVALPDTWREKKRRGKERERGAEGEWTWQRPCNRSIPLSRAKGVCSRAVSTSH